MVSNKKKKDIQNNYGGGLLVTKYTNSPLMFLKGVFPDIEWFPWMFDITSMGYWDDIENHVKYANWLGKKLGYTKMEDWYQIKTKDIHNNHGRGLLANKYTNSTQMFLKSVFPHIEWLPWMFVGSVTNGYWDNVENRVKYAKWLGEKLGYTKMEDWYQINAVVIQNNHGSGLLATKYNSSPLMFLKGVFPDIEWLPWLLDSSAPMGYWDDIENHVKYAKWLGEKLGYTKMEDWYQINVVVIQNNHGGGLLATKYYNSSPLMFLKGVFPKHTWDSSKFRKKSIRKDK